jgi:hypothetical protein
LSADYGISSYYKSDDGIYVNLFLPSRLSWSQNNTPCTLTQTTQYPKSNQTQLEFSLGRPETFTVYLRIPAWAGAKTRVQVNGGNVDRPVEPGKFLAIQRTWKDGDRVEMELEQPLRLEAVDDQNTNVVALMRGPVALFAVGSIPGRITRDQLLAAAPAAQSSDDWQTHTDSGVLTLRPFSAIMSEDYTLYLHVG